MEDSAAVEWLCEEPLRGSGTGQVKTDIINEACAMMVQWQGKSYWSAEWFCAHCELEGWAKYTNILSFE